MFCFSSTNIALLILLLLTNKALCQTYPLVKEQVDIPLWLNFNVERFDSKGNVLFLEANWQAYTQITEANAVSILPFQQLQHTLGYETQLQHGFGVGLWGRHIARRGRGQLWGRLYLQHSGKIGKTDFYKQIGIENTTFLNSPTATRHRQGVSGMLALARNFGMPHNRTLRISTAYEASILLDQVYSRRRIDQTRWRIEAAYTLTTRTSLGVFFIHATDYFFAEAEYNADLTLKKPDRLLNLLSPTFGLRLHYLVLPATMPSQPLRILPY